MAKATGIPMAHHAKKHRSIATAARLISLEPVLPGAAEQPAQTDRAGDDHADHEQSEAGVEQVHADLQDERVLPRREQDVVDGLRQADDEHYEDGGRAD